MTRLVAERYEVLDELGHGGTAVVYKVRDVKLNSINALKSLLLESPDEMVRFQREAKVASTLRHPNIVSLLDFGVDQDSKPFIVMDFVDGITLSEYLKEKGPPPVHIAISIFSQIADAMSYIHKHDLLHRDLKPSNIVVLSESLNKSELKVQILDFGLAKSIQSQSETLTQPGVAIGTPKYMSPEQASGAELDERSDIYSFGVLIYEVLTGKTPFDAESAIELINMHLSEPPPSLADEGFESEHSDLLEKIVSRCLEKESARRFSSMAAIRVLLEEALKEPEVVYDELEKVQLHKEKVSPKDLSLWQSLNLKIIVPVVLILLIGGGMLLRRIYVQESHPEKIGKIVDFKVKQPGEVEYLRDFQPVTWESGIVWNKQFLIDDDALFGLKQNTKFKCLSLYDEKRFSSFAFSHVMKIPFAGLGLGKTLVTGKQLKELVAANPNLEALYLQAVINIKEEDLSCITGLKKLRFLALTQNQFGDQAMLTVAKMKSLEVLKIDDLKFLTDSGIKKLLELPELRCLCIDRNKVGAAGWKYISELRKLKLLSATETGMTDSDLKLISKLNLEKMDISANDISLDGLKVLYNKPNLKIVRIKSPRVNRAELQKLKGKIPGIEPGYDAEQKAYSRQNALLMTDSSLKDISE